MSIKSLLPETYDDIMEILDNNCSSFKLSLAKKNKAIFIEILSPFTGIRICEALPLYLVNKYPVCVISLFRDDTGEIPYTRMRF